MNSNAIPKIPNKGPSFVRNEVKPIPLNRSSFQIHHYSNGLQPNSVESSPRPNILSKYSFGSLNSNNSSYDRNRDPLSWEHHIIRDRSQVIKKKKAPAVPKSSGLIYTTNINRELSSIDKINDPLSNALICAGKTHLGYYKFSEHDHNISLVHDFSPTGTGSLLQAGSHTPNLNSRHRRLKLSTIADVKTGFHNYNNYIAVCSNSTILSLYDANRAGSIDNPLITSLSEHTRSINSFDFNMVQCNLLISGGQDGCIKIWDLRSSSSVGSSRCDININTASDSIRDVKWMPGYNFSSNNPNILDSRQNVNAGFKFASIHDSGLLLKFDIRQPSHAERKINAHTGPGLCLNWHQNLEYIATGGRDGKCCLWYVGDTTNEPYSNIVNSMGPSTPHSNSYNHFQLNANNAVTLPEITINTRFPVTKLKFRPFYEKNVMNSLLAISSMGDEAEVNIFSLSRKFIPKHVLLTTAASQGLVWWDDKLIFNIDRANRINGWNIDQEPTVLDNLPKSIATWRDIDGSGLLVVDQNPGSYTANEDYVPIIFDKRRRQGNRLRNQSVTDSNSIPKSKFLDSFKKGISHTNLLSTEADKRPLHISGNVQSSKSIESLTGYLPHNQFNSFSNVPTPSYEGMETRNILSPYMITLDLPHIFNNMRLSRINSMKSSSKSLDIAAIKESPIQVFQFLARELEFSFSKDRRSSDSSSILKQKKVSEDTESQEDLIKKFGFTDTTTWTNLINRKPENDSAHKSIDRSSNESESIISASTKDENKNQINISSTINSESKDNEQNEVIIEDISHSQERIDLLFELVAICKHNASIYSYIDDLPNFKVWILIRDSLLWDLKTLTAEQEPIDRMESSREDAEFQYFEDSSDGHRERHDSVNTQLTDLPSEMGSFVAEHPKQLVNESMKGSSNSPLRGNISKLRQQLKGPELGSNSRRSNSNDISDKNITERIVKEVIPSQKESITPELLTDDSNYSRTSSAVTEDNEDSEGTQIDNANGIPILPKRKHRTSFIDTFMTNERSPFERPEGEYFSRASFSTNYEQGSPGSKLSSLHSFNNVDYSLNNLKKLSQNPNVSRSPTFGSSPLKVDGFLSPNSKNIPGNPSGLFQKVSNLSKINDNKSTVQPWNTDKLIKQLFNQAVETGNILLAINIMTLFQDLYNITTFDIVKNSLLQFIDILHRYELFEIATALLKYCPWENILDDKGGESTIRLYCERCHKLIVNESSKERFTDEIQKLGNKDAMKRFGYWYCDSCKKPNSLCVVCERPMKGLAMTILSCGHEGHFDCLKNWFLDEGMNECPGGDIKVI